LRIAFFGCFIDGPRLLALAEKAIAAKEQHDITDRPESGSAAKISPNPSLACKPIEPSASPHQSSAETTAVTPISVTPSSSSVTDLNPEEQV